MQVSKHNIFSKLRDSENFFIVNLLSGNADILTPEKAHELLSGDFLNPDDFRGKGYLVEPNEENRLYKKAYLDFIDARDSSELQIFFVPWYSCNFNCSYCYQEGYSFDNHTLNKEVINSFYSYIDTVFAGRRKYITLFGGEPLLAGEKVRDSIQNIIQGASERQLDIAIVTNGYRLSEYLDLFQGASIREIQVTLDGTEQVHNSRRYLKTGAGTFQKVVQGINDALDTGLMVNLRIVMDKENIGNLPDLARFASEQGWTQSELFKTQLGRNYELHTCQFDQEKLFSRVSLFEELYRLTREHPEILDFHKPSYSISKFLFENGELPQPLFDACPGCTTEWAFDYTGRIYPCTATVGKKGEEVGTFYPRVRIDEEKIIDWEERDVTTIPKCSTCKVQLACGGGCAAIARNREDTIGAPDCRPVTELLEMGISFYFDRGEE